MAVTTKGQVDEGISANGGAPGELESFNPATGERIGSVPTITPQQVQGVVDDVAEVQPFWAQLSLAERAAYLRRAAQVLLDHSDEIAELITREQGKPRLESYTMEVLPTVDALHWCADNGPKILAREPVRYPQLMMKQKKSAFSYEPIGVVGVIAPWNYPWSIPFGEVAIALMAGNGVVLKPASLTPLIGQRIQETFERAGLPQGLVQTVHGGGAVGQALVESTAGKIFFTGSVEIGRGVGEECARRMKGSVLELGGKDPQIVCADANLANAISGAVWGGFANAGQTCSGIERVYVVDDVAERFIDGVVRKTTALTVGDPAGWSTEIGPMVSREQYDLVCELVDDAIAVGSQAAVRRPGRGPGALGPLHRADRPHRRHPRHADHARGDLRPRPPDRARPKRGRGDRPRERLAVRPRRLGVDTRPGKGRADRRSDRGRHGLDQRPLVHARDLSVRLGRRQGLRPRAVTLEVRVLRVREHQDGVVGAIADGGCLVAAL